MSNHLFNILQQAGVSVQYGHQRLLAKLSIGPVVVSDGGRSAYQISIVRGLAVIEAVSCQAPADIMVRLEPSAVVAGRPAVQQPPSVLKFPTASPNAVVREMSREEFDKLLWIEPSELRPYHE
ncbi:hypothetical protein ACWAUP_005921 [Pseudomonas aeruginosa]